LGRKRERPGGETLGTPGGADIGRLVDIMVLRRRRVVVVVVLLRVL
jgi:hypothetical protein